MNSPQALVDQLNQVIVRQQRQLDQLIREVADLRQQRLAEDVGSLRGPRDELPPHF
jgi:SlyX protein